MDSDKLYITTDDGQEKTMTILFTFDSEDYHKSYVVFYDPQESEEDVYVCSYDADNLYAVTDEQELAMVSEVLEAWQDAGR